MTAFSRRGLLRGLALGLGVTAVGASTGCSLISRPALNTVGAVTFANPLHIPPLAESTMDAGVRVFQLALQAGQSNLVPQGPTATWGINQALLGPTLRVGSGEQVRLEVTNTLDEATILHWHGMRLPAGADGGPHQSIIPAGTWSPSWTINQPAATLWYHSHPHGVTEAHSYRGLGGMILIDDDTSQSLSLPTTYGVDDLPLIIQDRTFDDTGALVETTRRDVGMLGETMMINGTVGPSFAVTASTVRLRLLNGSAARSYNVGFADDRPFALIGTDGGLLPAPVQLNRVLLTPAERAEIVVSFTPGEQVVLRSFPHDLGVTSRLAGRAGALDELDLLQFSAAGTLTDPITLPTTLAEVTPPDQAQAAQRRVFSLGNNRINNLAMDMKRIDALVKAETVEVWTVTNAHTKPHNFHIHDVQFLVLDVDGQPPQPQERGWKDTVYVAPGVSKRLVMSFGRNADPQIPYMFHCHLLWHEDQGMMGQFTVT